MCSVSPTDLSLAESIVDGNELCIKCKHRSASVNIRFAVYCDVCFLEQTSHKYRASIGKTRSRTTREKILLLVDEDFMKESIALLLLATEYISTDSSKRHFDRFFACSFSENQHASEILERSEIPFTLLSLGAEYRLSELRGPITTGIQDIVCAYRLHAISCLARELQVDRVYFPTTCNDLALSVFKLTIKGMGYAVPWEQEIVKSVFAMQVVRPLREHHRKEIDEYLRIKGLSISQDEVASSKSLNDLTSDFLSGLDEDYSATVSTITKTVAKVTSNIDCSKFCRICSSPSLSSLCVSCATNLSELPKDFIIADYANLFN